MIVLLPRGGGLNLNSCRLIWYYMNLKWALKQNPRYLIDKYFEDTKYGRIL